MIACKRRIGRGVLRLAHARLTRKLRDDNDLLVGDQAAAGLSTGNVKRSYPRRYHRPGAACWRPERARRLSPQRRLLERPWRRCYVRAAMGRDAVRRADRARWARRVGELGLVGAAVAQAGAVEARIERRALRF